MGWVGRKDKPPISLESLFDRVFQMISDVLNLAESGNV